MRFKDFLKEDDDVENQVFNEEQFKKDCAYYIELMKGKKGYLYRGIEQKIDSIPSASLHTFKPRTEPVGSSKRLHNLANQFFEKKFGYPFRNGMFTTGSEIHTEHYGRPYIIIPCGKFQWLSNPDIFDMFAEFLHQRDLIKRTDLDRKELYQHAEDITIELMEESPNWYHNKDLPECIASGAEIMVVCDKYYIFDAEDQYYLPAGL